MDGRSAVTRGSALLSAYRLASTLARPLVALRLAWQHRRNRHEPEWIRERTGRATLARPDGRLAWVHAANVNDGRALLTLVDRLVARGFNVLLSTRAPLSAHAVKRMLPAGSFHQFQPADVPLYVGRFLDHWRPDLVLLAGAELWPNVFVECARRAAPIILVNARLSDRVYANCRRVRSLFSALMGRVDLCLARRETDAERFAALGVASVQTVGDLALDQPLPGADPVAVSAFASRVGARPIWVAALIEPEETAFVLEAHRRLLPQYPNLLTVLVPRLPRDGEAAAAAASAQNLDVALRSRNALPRRLPGIFVGDIAGEIGLFYRASDVAFMGRSLTGRGHSPIEAAKLGCAVVHGPRTERFASLYQALDKAQGGVSVSDAAMLARVLSLLFDDGAKLRLMQRNAGETMDRLCGGTTRVMRAIEPHVVQMLVDEKARPSRI
jgi:3-deoxy-D-manno-octulosonic-acid transferase